MLLGGAAEWEWRKKECVCVCACVCCGFSNGDAAQLERKLLGLTRANTEGFETGFVW